MHGRFRLLPLKPTNLLSASLFRACLLLQVNQIRVALFGSLCRGLASVASIERSTMRRPIDLRFTLPFFVLYPRKCIFMSSFFYSSEVGRLDSILISVRLWLDCASSILYYVVRQWANSRSSFFFEFDLPFRCRLCQCRTLQGPAYIFVFACFSFLSARVPRIEAIVVQGAIILCPSCGRTPACLPYRSDSAALSGRLLFLLPSNVPLRLNLSETNER